MIKATVVAVISLLCHANMRRAKLAHHSLKSPVFAPFGAIDEANCVVCRMFSRFRKSCVGPKFGVLERPLRSSWHGLCY
jgi:hypothetical protein